MTKISELRWSLTKSDPQIDYEMYLIAYIRNSLKRTQENSNERWHWKVKHEKRTAKANLER